MFRSGVLVFSAPLATVRKELPLAFDYVKSLVKDTLYVGLHSREGAELPTSSNGSSNLAEVLLTVNSIYAQATKHMHKTDVRVLLEDFFDRGAGLPKCDVMFTDSTLANILQLERYSRWLSDSVGTGVHVIPCLSGATLNVSNVDSVLSSPSKFQHSCLGGTFDRLHNGHKALLSAGCLLSSKTLVVGVTESMMNTKKVLSELIEPINIRTDAVLSFITDIKPSLQYRIVPLTDSFGPAVVERELECIVVSEETKRGAAMINDRREAQGMPPLSVHVVPLLEDCADLLGPEDEAKISSSSLRRRLLGTVIRPPLLPHPSLPARPYIIGLTGGLASGKSTICKRLESFGAGIIDCDKLAHKAYEPSGEAYKKMVDTFGPSIVKPDSMEIDRKALAAIVFSNKLSLAELNAIVWPATQRLAVQCIADLAAAGKSCIVLEATLLLEAGWQSAVHEVWSSVVPPAEAVRRSVERNGWSEEEAKRRIAAQMANEERIDRSNVVLCSLWEYETTHKQVAKAWALLQNRMQSYSG